MAYYTALITAWNNASQASGATLPGGVTGSLLNGLTTANKLIAINGWVITGAVPTSFYVTGPQLLNCINWTEFALLTAAQQSNLLMLCNNPGPLLGGSSNTSFLVDGMILAYFNAAGLTVAALTALAKSTLTPWWQANGYSSPFSSNDLMAAGGLS